MVLFALPSEKRNCVHFSAAKFRKKNCNKKCFGENASFILR